MSTFAFSGPQGGASNPKSSSVSASGLYRPLLLLTAIIFNIHFHLNVKFFWVGSKPSGTSF